MLRASNEYKQIMARNNRNRGYVSISLGVVNQEAQQEAFISSDVAWYSQGSVFDNEQQETYTYATLEEDFFKTDGSMMFLPDETEETQLLNNGITVNFGETLRISWNNPYHIKGLTIEFDQTYPTELEIEVSDGTHSYDDIHNLKFETEDSFGDTTYMDITPISMFGGNQRMHIRAIKLGVGFAFSNTDVKNVQIETFISSISEEISYANYSFEVYDKDNKFDVDNSESFMDYLEMLQPVKISMGLQLDDGTVEWLEVANAYLDEWDISRGVLNIHATDKLSQLENEYSNFVIEEKTAYEMAVDVLTDAGFTEDEYILDDYLNTITFRNPLPVTTHRECLQILANACRCVAYENEFNQVVIKANLSNVIDPEDFLVDAYNPTEYSKPTNIFVGSSCEYADLTLNTFRCDGTMTFLPEEPPYLETAYISEEIADLNGEFSDDVGFSIEAPASFTYFGASIRFGANVPREIIVNTYKNTSLVESFTVSRLSKATFIEHDFLSFDTIEILASKNYPHNRFVVEKFSFGGTTDYSLTKDLMMERPHGFKEQRVKDVKVRIYTYDVDDEGKPVEVADEVYYTNTINATGITKTVLNPLIHTVQQAQDLAEWIGNYYRNNVSYSVKYRGEPRLQASDIIHMESDFKDNLQVEVQTNQLKFNGAWSGELELRRALKNM